MHHFETAFCGTSITATAASKKPILNENPMKKTNKRPTATTTPGLFMRAAGALQRSFDSTYDCTLLVLLVAALTYLPGYGKAGMFWDENYHITAAERYIEGVAQFEAHPPLGKLLIAAGEVITRTNQQIDKHELVGTKYIAGNKLPKGFSLSGMRLMPSLFAVLAAGCFFGLMFSLTQNRLASVVFSGLYVFENAYIVHFRAAHLDSFQLCFSLGALWYFVTLWRSVARLKATHYALLGGIIGLAIMVKINAVLLLLLFPLLYWQDHKRWRANLARRPTDFLKKSGAAIAAILAVTLLVFWISALCGRQMPDPESSAGRDDTAKMSPAYKQFLAQKEWLTPDMVVQITVDNFRFMLQNHEGVPKLDVCKTEENGSHPMHWPMMDKTINYRWDTANGKTGYIQLAGNPVSWGLGLCAAILSLGLILSRRVFQAPVRDEKTYALIEAFSLLYVAYICLHLWLASQRVMYLYHYFLGLVISYALLVLVAIYLANVWPWVKQRRTAIIAVTLIAIIASYAFFAPLTYHLPISKSQCEQRNWLFKTVNCI